MTICDTKERKHYWKKGLSKATNPGEYAAADYLSSTHAIILTWPDLLVKANLGRLVILLHHHKFLQCKGAHVSVKRASSLQPTSVSNMNKANIIQHRFSTLPPLLNLPYSHLETPTYASTFFFLFPSFLSFRFPSFRFPSFSSVSICQTT